MRGADHLSCRIGARGQTGQVARDAAICITKIVVLLITTFDAGIEHVQREQIAKVKAAVNLEQIGAVRRADRHPFVINLGRNIFACGPVALRQWVVVFCAADVGIVGKFMVIPNRDPGHLGMQGLQHRIRAVQGVACAVVVQADHVVGRDGDATERHGIGVAELLRVRAVFIQVVAQMDGVLRVGFGGGVIGIEKAFRIERAGEHSELDRTGIGSRQGPRGANRRDHTGVIDKTVKVAGASRQAGDVDLCCEGRGFRGLYTTGPHHRGEGIVGSHLPGQPHGIDTVRNLGMGPQNDAVRQWVATGDAVFEIGFGSTAAASGQRAYHGDGCGSAGSFYQKVATAVLNCH